MLLASLLIAAAAYLLGSIPTGYLLVRIFRHQDIRTVGSGNIGATNVLRSGGKGLGAATFLLDMLKGCSAVWLGALLGGAAHARRSGAHRPGSRRSLCRPRPHVPRLASLPRRQGRSHRLWRLPGRRSLGRSGRHHRLRSRPPHQPLCLAGLHPRRGQLSRLCLATGQPALGRPFFIAVQFAVALLIIAKHHQNIRRLLAGTESRLGSPKQRTESA